MCAIHPKIAKTIDACLNGFVEGMNCPDIPINSYIIKDFDSININILFYQDSNNNLRYDVFTFHRLVREDHLLGCYPLNDRTLLYVYDESGFVHNFIDTTQLLKPWASRYDHVIRYPERIWGELVIEGLEYLYLVGYQATVKEKKDTMYLISVKERPFSTINQENYTYYPILKWFLGL